MNNPFEELQSRFSNIEKLLLDIKHKEVSQQATDPDRLMNVGENTALAAQPASSKYQLSLKINFPFKLFFKLKIFRNGKAKRKNQLPGRKAESNKRQHNLHH
jgi:hypothetical protein